MGSAERDELTLVNASVNGDRDAFAQIVAPYQTLVASVAYSASGNLSQSEDIAQETFVTAWKQLKSLGEASKLRSWLCGIARRVAANVRRRDRREPLQGAAPLDHVMEAPAMEALPVERAITHEEESILWRSLEQISDTYREPLILFYRENKSIERVAEQLDLSEEAVRQRWATRHKPVKAWIAIADVALGGLFAMGGVAIAPIAFGGFAFGAVLFAGFGAGILSYAGFALGFWAMGGVVVGVQAIGGCAIGWTSAVGGIAIAHQFAQGGIALAAHANDVAAQSYAASNRFFAFAFPLMTKWLWPTMIPVILPSLVIWQLTRRKRHQ